MADGTSVRNKHRSTRDDRRHVNRFQRSTLRRVALVRAFDGVLGPDLCLTEARVEGGHRLEETPVEGVQQVRRTWLSGGGPGSMLARRDDV